MPKPAGPMCKNHKAARAGWTCETCQASLCPDCVATLRVGLGTLPACVTCRQAVHPILVPRAEQSFAASALGAVTYPLHLTGFIAMGAAGLVMAVVSFRIGAMAMTAYSFSLLMKSAAGKDQIEPPDFTDIFNDLVMPTVRATIAAVPVIAAWIWWGFRAVGLYSESHAVEAVLADPMLYLVAAGSVTYAPIAFIAAAAQTPILQLLNPVLMAAYAVKLGTDYLVAVGAFVVVFVLRLVVFLPLSAALSRLPVPLLGSALGAALTIYPQFVLARILGLLLRQRGDAIGFGGARDYQDPILGDAQPRAKLPGQADPREVVDVAPAPQLDLGGVAAVRPTHIELDATFEDVQRALHDKQIERAVSVYRDLPAEEAAKLPAASLMLLGQGAAGVQDLQLAMRALKAAATSGDTNVAPRAMVVMARIYAERLGDEANALKVYRHVAATYPDTEAAKFANARLAAKAS